MKMKIRTLLALVCVVLTIWPSVAMATTASLDGYTATGTSFITKSGGRIVGSGTTNYPLTTNSVCYVYTTMKYTEYTYYWIYDEYGNATQGLLDIRTITKTASASKNGGTITAYCYSGYDALLLTNMPDQQSTKHVVTHSGHSVTFYSSDT